MKKKIILSVLVFVGLACFSAPEYNPKPCKKTAVSLTPKKKTEVKQIKQVKKVKKSGEENIPFNILMYHTNAL